MKIGDKVVVFEGYPSQHIGTITDIRESTIMGDKVKNYQIDKDFWIDENDLTSLT